MTAPAPAPSPLRCSCGKAIKPCHSCERERVNGHPAAGFRGYVHEDGEQHYCPDGESIAFPAGEQDG